MLLLVDMWKVYTVAVLALFPILFTAASGLVPCGGSGEPLCQTCHVVALISNVSDWLVMILGIVAAIIIVVSGLQIVMSVGNTGAVTQARRRIYSMLIGYVILLSGWLLLDLGLKMLLSDAAYGTWNVIQCTVQPQAIPYSRQTASGDSATVLPPAAVSGRVAAITSSGSLQTDIANAAAAAGITDQAQVNKLRALISQESSNCTNKVGPATDYGTAYGCGQMLVGTARSLDPALSGMSDTEVANKLRDDNAYNLTLSAKYYKQLLGMYGNSSDLALAAYNGGPVANQPSKDCPGQKRWQCVWDSPGCYGTGKTDCIPNKGPNSYEQTRHYVTNINAIAGGL